MLLSAVNSSGAVSPEIRAMANSTPVMMPERAARYAHEHDHPPFRATQRRSGFAQAVGHQLQHVVGRAHHHRDHQDGQRERRPPSRNSDRPVPHKQVDKQANKMGWRGQQHIVQEAGSGCKPAALAVFGQNRYPPAHRWACRWCGDRRHQYASDDGVEQAAAYTRRRRGFDHQRQRQCIGALENKVRMILNSQNRPVSTMTPDRKA